MQHSPVHGLVASDNTAKTPIALPRPGQLRIVPRHMDSETVDRALEWHDYHNDPALEHARTRDDATAVLVQNEDERRWDDYVDACAPTFTTRAEALAFIEAFTRGIEQADLP